MRCAPKGKYKGGFNKDGQDIQDYKKQSVKLREEACQAQLRPVDHMIYQAFIYCFYYVFYINGA